MFYEKVFLILIGMVLALALRAEIIQPRPQRSLFLFWKRHKLAYASELNRKRKGHWPAIFCSLSPQWIAERSASEAARLAVLVIPIRCLREK